MDDLTLIRNFRAERADEDPQTRADAWLALEARFELASSVPGPRRNKPRRRSFFAFAGVASLAAILAGILVFSSGPNAESAAGKVLRETAGVAAENPPATLPGPGQFLFTKTQSVELQGWLPGRATSFGGQYYGDGAFEALVPTTRELWWSPVGRERSREVQGQPQFFSEAERNRWEQAGSPLAAPFDPSSQDRGLGGSEVEVREARRGVVDIVIPAPKGEDLGPRLGFPDLSDLPTDPAALREAVRAGEITGFSSSPGGEPADSLPPLDTEESIGVLMSILSTPTATPGLRSTAFEAIAELPGIELDRNAADLVGHSGYSVAYEDNHGLRNEYIFDPVTATILGQRSVILDPSRTPMWKGVPAGTVLRETAYLQSAVIDSMR
jgi:hypothetical protein